MTYEKVLEVSRFLKSTRIFSDVPSAALETAAQHCRLIAEPRGAVLYQKGKPANSMYFLRTGYVMESVFYRDSVDVIVKIKCPGDYFGETAVMTNMDYQNTALVTEDAALIVMPKETFLSLAWTYHEVCQVVIRQLVERLTNSAQNMVNSMYLDAPARLAFTILNLTTDGSRRVEIHVTQGALAASAGMARQTAAKILSDWRKAGWVTTERGLITVPELDRLVTLIADSELHG